MMIGLAAADRAPDGGEDRDRWMEAAGQVPGCFHRGFHGDRSGGCGEAGGGSGDSQGRGDASCGGEPGVAEQFSGAGGHHGDVPDRTMFIGVDPNKAFKMMELDFREGNTKDAERMLKLGRHVLVTAEFKRFSSRELGVGDKLPLKTDRGWVDYTIAGVVWSPGIDVMVTIFDMGRQMEQRTAACVFGTIEDAQRDFGVKRFLLFAANLEYYTEKEAVLKDVQKTLRAQGMRAGDVRQIKARIQEDVWEHAADDQHRCVRGDGRRGAGRDQHDHGEYSIAEMAVRNSAEHRGHAAAASPAGHCGGDSAGDGGVYRWVSWRDLS